MTFSRTVHRFIGLVGCLLLVAASCLGTLLAAAPREEVVASQAIAELQSGLESQQSWVKVHAAEYLLRLGLAEQVFAAFAREQELYHNQPQYRIGVWRVLAQCDPDPQRRANWIQRIFAAFCDENGVDRVHAGETLAKLGKSRCGDLPILDAARQYRDSDDRMLSRFATWILAEFSATPTEGADLLLQQMSSPDEEDRRIAAYALRFNGKVTPEQWEKLANNAVSEPEASSAKPYLIGAAYVLAPLNCSAETRDELEEWIIQYLRSTSKPHRLEAIVALAYRGDKRHFDLLEDILAGSAPLIVEDQSTAAAGSADVRMAAADAVVRIQQRQPQMMSWIDWAVIAIYCLVMLWIGYLYSGSAKSKEEYLLGGRSMNPLAVGLSLFATLLSTLSYLSYPGEMIRNGPLIFAGLLVFPVVYWIVGWGLIPAIMAYKVTSAYEILEIRLGRSVRLLGTFFFLSLRLLWMATIIYVTADTVLVPLFGISHAYTPAVCLVMGIVTLIYTSMGGLKAVVVTDVIQTVILIAGALLTLGLIWGRLSASESVVPTRWLPQWEPIRFEVALHDRFTVANAMIMVFVWYICTAGSDQMAIQRYLATRDAAAARKTFGISLIVNLLVQVTLAFVGLALLAHFSNRPDQLPEGIAVYGGADQLFTRFILVGLPVGITGLVTGSLMAAAMSSLSSGMNSSCVVATEDLLGLIKKEKSDGATARGALLFIGAIVILLSVLIRHVDGNLLEITIRVVNLFVAPLFVLFALAMFVPGVTSTGAIVGGLTSLATAFAIAFFEIFGLGVPWIMPAALIGGIIVGWVTSFFESLLRRL